MMSTLWGEPESQAEGSVCSEWVWSEPSGLLDWLVSNAVRTEEREGMYFEHWMKLK